MFNAAILTLCHISYHVIFSKKKKFLQFLNDFYNLQPYKSQSYKCSPLLIYLLPLSPYNKLIQSTSYLFSSTIKPNPKPFQFSLKEKEIKNIKCSSRFGRKKKREAFRVLKGGKKREQRESLKFVT